AARPANCGPLRAYDGDVLEVLCVARLAPQKDLACLCEAVRLVEEQYPGSLRVKVAGEGPERTRLEEFIEEYDLPVELLGRVEDTRALMRETHVVVQTSAWEGQPVAIQEAIGEGAAIIATDAGGTRWVTGERIPLVAPANARELAERLIAFVPGHPGSEERLGELRAASRARAAELPTEEDLIAQLESALFTFADDEENQRS
ncbi:MAG: glycosyltransferase, partial [Dermabacter sp.]|nr:glycosyltransferase [Dermabacter sp.]